MVTQDNPQLRETRADRLWKLLEPHDVVRCGVPQTQCGFTAEEMTRRAVTRPLGETPSLSRMVVPGDRVTIALDTGVPAVTDCLAAVVAQLVEAGITPSRITVLQSAKEARVRHCDLCSGLPATIATQIQRRNHARGGSEELAYLASTRGQHRVYVHPALVDADVVIPIGKYRPGAESFGVHQCWFPRFSDQATWRRFQPRAGENPKVLRRETQEVAWLLGLQFLVQVLPGGDPPVQDVIAGEVASVQRQARENWLRRWQTWVPTRAPLVVADLSGGRTEQTWSNLLRIIDQAEAILDEDGALAICSNLRAPPGPALRQLMQYEDWSGNPSISPRHADAPLAASLLRAQQQQRRIYLYSQLAEDVVESLHFVHVEAISQLARLASQFDRTVLLCNAQYAVPQLRMSDSQEGLCDG